MLPIFFLEVLPILFSVIKINVNLAVTGLQNARCSIKIFGCSLIYLLKRSFSFSLVSLGLLVHLVHQFLS